MKKPKVVDVHRLREVKGSEHSYSNFVEKRGKTEDGEPQEDSRANPDVLAEGQHLWGDSEMTTAQSLMGEAITHLQGQQKEVYLAIMRDGLTESQVAKRLGISRQAVSTYKARAIEFITDYCRRSAGITDEDLNETL